MTINAGFCSATNLGLVLNGVFRKFLTCVMMAFASQYLLSNLLKLQNIRTPRVRKFGQIQEAVKMILILSACWLRQHMTATI